METFDTIEKLYAGLEEKATDYKYSYQIANLFQKIRDIKHKENNLEDAEMSQWEIDFWRFVFIDGKMKPNFTGTDEKGEPFEYPNISRFNEKTYDYLIKRLEGTSNPVIKARYAHILWNSPKKHTKFASLAVDAYLELVPIYEVQDKTSPNDYLGLNALHAIKNAYFVSKQANYQTDKVKSEIKRLVHQFSFESSYSFTLRSQLIGLMLQEKFHKNDYNGIPEICRRLSQKLSSAGNIHGAIDVFELGEKVDLQIGSKTYNWRKDVAVSYERLMEQADKDENPACISFCQWALENYKLAKEQKKVEQLEKKYSKLKSSIKLTEFKTDINLSDHVKRCITVADKVTANTPDEIIKVLMLDKNLLPRFKDVEKVTEEHAKQFVAMHLFPHEILDQSGNTAQHFTDDDEKRYFEILQQYFFELQYDKLHLINEIVLAGIRTEKLTTNNLLSFLKTNSWFGKNIQRQTPNRQTETYSWLDLLAPSIHEFFLQLNYALANAHNHLSLVLCIDSLTLKIEGLLRDLCRFSGVSTFYMTKDSKGRTISREKDIHALLYEDKIKELFDEDDLLFFKFLLVEKAGFNLRHRVAHALMIYQEYGLGQMYLLLLALLRIGKYDFIK